MAVKPRKQRDVSLENEPLTPEELAEFREILLRKRADILDQKDEQNRRVLEDDQEKLPDEVDLASAEYEAAFENRLRDREKYLLKKIDKALERLDEGVYDECDSCGALIGKKRLLARPEATLCIVCKEEQEQVEKSFVKPRLQREEEFAF